jgi:hypothetical protein
MQALFFGGMLFLSINLVFFGGLWVIMALADMRSARVHKCADIQSWCEHCLDDKQRKGIVNIFGDVMARG